MNRERKRKREVPTWVARAKTTFKTKGATGIKNDILTLDLIALNCKWERELTAKRALKKMYGRAKLKETRRVARVWRKWPF